jgi:hypothetical protein
VLLNFAEEFWDSLSEISSNLLELAQMAMTLFFNILGETWINQTKGGVIQLPVKKDLFLQKS